MRSDGPDGGEAIVQACRDLGVDFIFSSPGSDWGAVWEALSRQEAAGAEGPRYLQCAHELAAVDVALGYAAATGRLQVVLLHAGVGLMQAAMGLYGARLAELPLLVLSGESTSFGEQADFDPGPQWYHNHNSAGGMAAFAQPVVKWAHQAGAGADLYARVLHAGALALAPPAGPAYLGVPLELLREPWRPAPGARQPPLPPRTRPSDADIDSVAREVLAARHPLIVAGSPGRTHEGFAALHELAHALALPVVETPASDVGSFALDDPLHQGFDVRAAVRAADLVLVVQSRTPWYPPHIAPSPARVIVVDEHPFKTHMAYQRLHADALLGGDVPTTLRLLARALRTAAEADRGAAKAAAARQAGLAAAHAQWRERIAGEAREARAAEALTGVAVAAALAETMPRDTIYVDETTVHLHGNRRHVGYRDAQSYLALRAGLGQGLGIALGTRLARRDRPVVALIGDGAFHYNPALACLGCARDAKLPIVVVVFNNGGYRAMRDSQLAFYPDGVARHGASLGETLSGIDYERLAELFGGLGLRVETPAALAPALRAASAAARDGRTAVVNVLLRE